MRKASTLLGTALLLAAAPMAAEGQLLLGPTLAWHDDADLGIGATVGFELPDVSEGVGFLGDFIIFFPDGMDYFELNGNLTYDFPLAESTVLPFALAGLNVGRASVDLGPLGDASDTEVSLNLGGGIAFDAGSFRPKAGGRFIVGDGTSFVLFITLPFRVGAP
ncbi:MAG TPA: hypothetical protein VLH75_03735 [Longimicrobiales bacterium]|nr:hypothetical protein [Longimicrobiales bacterium]